jgi:hypothetical protein
MSIRDGPRLRKCRCRGPEIYYGYLPEVYVAKDRALGMVDLTQGWHILTFICTGRDPRSVGYKLGLNDIVLERFEEKPAKMMTLRIHPLRRCRNTGSSIAGGRSNTI